MNVLSGWGLALALIGLACLGVSGPGYRARLWGFQTGITLVKFSTDFSLVAVALCLVGAAVGMREPPTGSLRPAMLGFVVSAVVLAITLKQKLDLDRYPDIHDLSTDTERPPLFVKILPLRIHAENPAGYGGPEIARQQHAAYPNLSPSHLRRTPDLVFPQALRIAEDMGWTIVSADLASLQIEATATTWWFGFQDDVIVRLDPMATGTRVDVRSVSRVGKSDLGTNARRITTYLNRLEAAEASSSPAY